MQRIRRSAWIGVAAAAIAWAAPVAAQTSRDYDWCVGKGEPSHDQTIQGCTAILHSRRESRQNRGIAYGQRAHAYYNKGDYDLAIQDYDEAIRLDPRNSDAFKERGLAYDQKRDYDRAIADHSEAIRIIQSTQGTKRNLADALRSRGNVYDDKDEGDNAIRDYDEAIRVDPEGAVSYIRRGISYFEKGNVDRAIQDLTKAIALPNRLNEVGLATAHYWRGCAYLSNRDFDHAIADYDEAIRFNSKHAYSFYGRGRAYKGRGDQDRAGQDYDTAIRLDPSIVSYYLREGNKHRDKGFRDKRQFDLAIEDYDAAIELDPTSAKAYLNRAIAYLHKETVDRAIQDYDRAIALDSESTDAWHGRGQMYRNKQQYGRAIEDYDRALATLAAQPADDAAGAVKRGSILDERCHARSLLGQLETALGDCNEARKLQPYLSGHNRASVYLKLGQYDDAIADYNANLHIMPTDAGSIYGRGLARLKKGDLAGGNADIAAAKTIEPNVARAFSAWYGIGEEPYSRPPTEAVPHVPATPPVSVPAEELQAPAADKAPTAAPAVPDSKLPTVTAEWKERDWCEGKDVVAPDSKIGGCTAVIQSGRATTDLLAEAFNNRGKAYSDKQEYDTAILDFDQAIRLKPEKAGFFNNRGYAHHQRRDYDRAIVDYNEALRLDPNYADAFSNRGLAYYEKAYFDRALADCNEAIRLNPDDAFCYFTRGNIHHIKGDDDRAIQDFDQVIRLQPHSANSWANRCWYRVAANQLPAALADCAESLRLRPDDPDNLYRRGFVYLRMDRFDSAIADFNAALQTKPKIAGALYGRGIAKLKTGDANGGNADIAAAKEIEPDIAKQMTRYGVPSAQTVSAETTEEILKLTRQINEFRKAGRYAEAIPLQQRVLAIRENLFGPDHPNIAASLNNLAGLYLDQGRYVEAEPLYKRALAIVQKSFGPDHPNAATVLNNLAFMHSEQGRYADAEPLYKQALAIRENSLGPDHPDVGQSLNHLGGLYDIQGRYADAEPLYKRALAILEKSRGPYHPDVGQSLNNLALLYKEQGRYVDAEPLYKRSLAIVEKSFGTNHPETALTLNNLAQLYKDQARYADAEPLFKRALAIFEKSPGPDHPNVAGTLNNLASLYGRQGRYADAEPLHKRALVIWEKSLGPNHPNVASSLNNLAGVYEQQGRYADAEPLHKRALAIFENSLGPDHPNVAIALNNLAAFYRDRGRYADALPMVRRTIAQGSAFRSVAFPVLFQSQRQNLVDVAVAFDDSYYTVQRATSSAAANAVSQLAARFGAGTGPLAELVRRDQDLTAEEERLDKSMIAAISKPPAERNAAAEDQTRKRIEAIKSEHARLQETFNKSFPDYVAQSKPQPLSLTQTRALLGDDEALAVLYFGTTSYAWVITRTDADWVELKVSSKDLETEVRALRQSLTFGGDKPFDPQLAFKIYRETFGSFADRIAAKKRLSVVTNGALTSLPPALLVTKDPGGKELKDVDWLIRSHAVTILPSVSSLKILRTASATALAAKPMIAFGDPVFSRTAHAQAQQQVAMRSITTFYSGTKIDIASLRERLPQLPGTRAEVQAIARALNADANDIKLGLAVTETAVKQAKLDQYRIAYFATHGLVAGDLEQFTKSKAEPALALTIPDNASDFDDGLLSASEIAQLKLNADWVVLSACNTAAEDKPGAEALSGLARSFFYAGARSLIVSHWEVNDEATAQLMTGTFQAIARDPKLSHGEALRQSMLALIDNAKSDDDAHPRLWAPFVVVGEPAKSQ